MLYQKKLSLILCLSLGFLSLKGIDPVADYNSGRVRIEGIMTNEETGIAAYNKKNIHYAETQNLAKDLNIAQVADFFGCKTVIGRSFIEETLKFPVSPQDRGSVLSNRQNSIKVLVENPELKKEVDRFLAIAQQHEQEVVKLMSEFFMGQTCPELANLELIKKQSPWAYPLSEFFYLNPTGKIIGTTLGLVALGTTTYAMGYCGNITYKLAQAGWDYKELAGYTAYLGLIDAFHAYTMYKDYSTAAEKRLKMHSLNQLIDVAEKFEDLCIKYGMKSQFTMSAIKDEDGAQLIDTLKHARYQNKDTKLFMTPLVHTFLYKIYQQDKQLAQVFACIAEMDAYNAIATKIIESRSSNNKFCFVTFVDDAKPVIKAHDFWNVLVKNAVTNNIDENKHVILTGPNAGGKTTSIKALLQNIVLGQSFGIAAAQKFEITMFDVIYSYLNISDDLVGGLSLFASEVKRAQEILQRIKTLEPHKKFFFALDELFTGTVAEDGEVCAYNFIKRISAFENIQFIYATHFKKLKELGRNDIYCSNYKVDAPTKSAEGKMVYPFTLSQGASEVNVALDLAREAGLFA